ncbi:MAG TPA: GNAT family N-acetyltransferase [Methylocella sp.]|nr:GNAT family N-acetyltransferase [Methylocella sp.]
MTAPYTVHIAQSMHEIDPVQWDACANPDISAEAPRAPPPAAAAECGNAAPLHEGERFNPFLTHAFLSALEDSKSTGERAGWISAHVLVKDSSGRLAAAAPAYVKTHSLGEYVFDHGWADAYHRAGLRYYPKLQSAIPFTPVTGRRLLLAPGHGEAARSALIEGLLSLREKLKASSLHITFLTRAEWETLGACGFLLRKGQQFHFFNAGYHSFEDFLSSLASRKRKMIRRERKEALANGIAIELLTGKDISERHWDSFFEFYMDTGARKWGTPYLTRAFFSRAGEALSGHILLVMARRNGRYIAGAINFIGRDALYGRNWGAIEEHPFLHFEVCYYQAIEFAIAQGLSRVEAGAQGEHKLARGYLPAATYSAHAIKDKRFARAIGDYLERERVLVDAALRDYEELAPFRKGPPGPG